MGSAMNLSQETSASPKKIKVLYADDRAENVRSLLQGVQAANVLPEEKARKLILHQLDSDGNMKHNHAILHDPDALIEVDYATLMEKAIAKVRDAAEPYDLIVSDWYFGENDPDYKDSQVGGIWIMLWGQNRREKYKPVCKLYTAKQTQGGQPGDKKLPDFTLAKNYIREAFGIEISEIRKSETAASWQQHLEDYLSEVARQILMNVAKRDLVVVINYISSHLAFNRFHNSVQDKTFEAFRQDLQKLNEFVLHLPEGKTITFAHLFPLLIGRYLTPNSRLNFFTMSADEIAALLYARRLVFSKREERDEKLARLLQTGVDCQEFKEHDAGGNLSYGIELKAADYYEGPLTNVNNLLKQTLDYTFKTQSFYLDEPGFSQWLQLAATQSDSAAFNAMRQKTILLEFNHLKPSFARIPMALDSNLDSFDVQIHTFLQKVESDIIKRDEKECAGKNLDDKYARLSKQKVFDEKTKKLTVPLKCLFRVNVHDFLAETMQLQLLPKNEANEEGYEPLEARDFYWYGNAWSMREGVRAIVQAMSSEQRFFIMLKPKDFQRQALVRYKIILSDRGKGLSSIARAFVSGRGHLSKVVPLLQGFCELQIRSKIEGEEGIAYDVFWDTMDQPYPQMTKVGTEFVLTITQRRDR